MLKLTPWRLICGYKLEPLVVPSRTCGMSIVFYFHGSLLTMTLKPNRSK